MYTVTTVTIKNRNTDQAKLQGAIITVERLGGQSLPCGTIPAITLPTYVIVCAAGAKGTSIKITSTTLEELNFSDLSILGVFTCIQETSNFNHHCPLYKYDLLDPIAGVTEKKPSGGTKSHKAIHNSELIKLQEGLDIYKSYLDIDITTPQRFHGYLRGYSLGHKNAERVTNGDIMPNDWVFG